MYFIAKRPSSEQACEITKKMMPRRKHNRLSCQGIKTKTQIKIAHILSFDSVKSFYIQFELFLAYFTTGELTFRTDAY